MFEQSLMMSYTISSKITVDHLLLLPFANNNIPDNLEAYRLVAFQSHLPYLPRHLHVLSASTPHPVPPCVDPIARVSSAGGTACKSSPTGGMATYLADAGRVSSFSSISHQKRPNNHPHAEEYPVPLFFNHNYRYISHRTARARKSSLYFPDPDSLSSITSF